MSPIEAVTSIVFVADDDIWVGESLESLFRDEGRQPETFASAQAFLDRPRAFAPNCLVLDIPFRRKLRDRYASLSLANGMSHALVVSGLLNEQVAGELGIPRARWRHPADR